MLSAPPEGVPPTVPVGADLARPIRNLGTPPNQLPPTVAAGLFVVLAAAGFASVLGWSSLLDAVSFQPAGPGGSYGLTEFLYGTQVTGAILLSLIAARYRQAWIRLSDRGVEVGSAATLWEAEWASLGPVVPPRGNWAALAAHPTDGRRARSFFVTKQQAHAILGHPRCPAGRFPPEYWSWAGLPARRAGEVAPAPRTEPGASP